MTSWWSVSWGPDPSGLGQNIGGNTPPGKIISKMKFSTKYAQLRIKNPFVFAQNAHHEISCWWKHVFYSTVQTSANNSTEFRYSKITRKLAFIRGRILGQIWVSDSTRVIFELLLQFIIIESGPRFTEVWYPYMLILLNMSHSKI